MNCEYCDLPLEFDADDDDDAIYCGHCGERHICADANALRAEFLGLAKDD